MLFGLNCVAANYKVLNKNYLSIIKQAQSFESQGNIQKSNEYYQKADKIFPNRFESSFGLAKTYGWLKNNKASEIYFDELLFKYPDNIDILEQYALYLRDSGSYNIAIEQFEKLFLKTKQEKYKLNMAEIHYLLGNYNQAIDILNGYNTNEQTVQKLLANCYFNKADYKNASIYYKQYLKNNKSPEEQIKYGKSLFYSGNAVEAKAILEKYSLNKDVNITLGDIYLSLGEFNKAVTVFEQLLKEQPDDSELKLKYANSLIAVNNFEKANIVLTELVKVQPDNKETINLYTDSCFALKKFDDAEKVLALSVKTFIEDENFKVKLAKSLEAQGKFDQLGSYINEIENIKVKNPEIYNILGNYYTYKNDFNKSLNYYQLSYKENPNEETAFKIAEVYRFKNDIKNAEVNYKSLVDSEKFGVDAQTKLAYLQLQQGKLNNAKEMFKEISLKTDNEDAQKGLAEVYYLNEDYLKSIKILKNVENDNSSGLLLAKNYNKLLKGSEALNVLKGNSSNEARKLRAKIERDNAFQIAPIYSMGRRNGDLNQHITYQNYGFTASKNILPEVKVFSRFQMTPYRSKLGKAKGTVTSYALGTSGKIGLKTDYLGEISLDDFSNGGQAVLGKAIVDYRLSDNYKFRTGFERTLVDETILSAIGLRPEAGPLAEQLTGRIIDNKLVFDASAKLPYDGYLYTGYHLGYKKGKNSAYNPYQEIMGGIGKLLYATGENKLVSQIVTGYNIYYTGYRYNKLNYGGVSLFEDTLGSDGGSIQNIGGYFSPKRIIVNNISFKIKGALPLANLKYLNESYLGVQSLRYRGSDFTWGNNISVIWNEEGRLGVKLGYNANFYGVAKQQNFYVQLILRDFLRRQKCSETL